MLAVSDSAMPHAGIGQERDHLMIQKYRSARSQIFDHQYHRWLGDCLLLKMRRNLLVEWEIHDGPGFAMPHAEIDQPCRGRGGKTRTVR
jgi:hypothetical protein